MTKKDAQVIEIMQVAMELRELQETASKLQGRLDDVIQALVSSEPKRDTLYKQAIRQGSKS